MDREMSRESSIESDCGLMEPDPMNMIIRGRSVSDVANKTIKAVLTKGARVDRTAGPWAMHERVEKVPMLELCNVTAQIEEPMRRWNTRVSEGMCQEFLDYLLQLNPGFVRLTNWKVYSTWIDPRTNRYPYTYGERIFARVGTSNQWELCVRKLSTDASTRHALIDIWRPSDLLRDFVPCTLQWHFQVTEGRLDMTSMVRSQDALKGYFLDLFAYTHFHELMANELQLTVGTYTHFITNVHIYCKNEKSVTLPFARSPPLRTSQRERAEFQCAPLTRESRSTLIRALKSLYVEKKPARFVALIDKLPAYWRSYLAYQLLDRTNTASVNELMIADLETYLSEEMEWVLRERRQIDKHARSSRKI